MNPRQRRGVLLMIAAAIGAVAVFVMVLGYVGQVRNEVGQTTGVFRLTANVQPYEQVDGSMVEEVQLPAKYANEGFVRDPAALQGKVAATDLRQGAYLQRGMIVDAPALEQGQREIAIMIDAETGVAGKVNPGDVVDIYATFRRQQAAAGGGGDQPSCAVRVLNRVEVIDVGELRTTEDGEGQDANQSQGQPGGAAVPGGAAGGGAGGAGQHGPNVVPVTFALNPDDTLRLTYAESFAEKVRLALVGGPQDDQPPGNRLCDTPEAGQ